MRKRLLLLSAYDAQSHRQWRLTLEKIFTDYHWTQLALPPRHFNWRIRGNSLSWGYGSRKSLSQDYDLLVATSMVDLSSLRGFVPTLSQIPTIVYFHENQFAYPRNSQLTHEQNTSLVDAQLTSIYSALCANRIVFNSQYNKDSFLTGAQKLLSKLPDFVPSGIIDKLEQAIVIPVPLAQNLFQFQKKESHSLDEPKLLKVVWNHRWEYDKGPGLLLKVVEAVCHRKLPIKFYLLGQQFRHQPDEFTRIEKLLNDYGAEHPDSAAHLGFVPNQEDYYSMLSICDVVLSTSFHDFQGLAILEACALHCTPLTPSELVYPEYLGEQFMYSRNQQIDESISLIQIIERLEKWADLKARGDALPKFDVSDFRPDHLKKDYLALFNSLARNKRTE